MAARDGMPDNFIELLYAVREEMWKSDPRCDLRDKMCEFLSVIIGAGGGIVSLLYLSVR